MTNKEKLNELIDGLAVDLAPLTASVESSIPTTANHYGRYLSIISSHPAVYHEVIAIALVRAGANRHGVLAAVNLCK